MDLGGAEAACESAVTKSAKLSLGFFRFANTLDASCFTGRPPAEVPSCNALIRRYLARILAYFFGSSSFRVEFDSENPS